MHSQYAHPERQPHKGFTFYKRWKRTESATSTTLPLGEFETTGPDTMYFKQTLFLTPWELHMAVTSLHARCGNTGEV